MKRTTRRSIRLLDSAQKEVRTSKTPNKKSNEDEDIVEPPHSKRKYTKKKVTPGSDDEQLNCLKNKVCSEAEDSLPQKKTRKTRKRLEPILQVSVVGVSDVPADVPDNEEEVAGNNEVANNVGKIANKEMPNHEGRITNEVETANYGPINDEDMANNENEVPDSIDMVADNKDDELNNDDVELPNNENKVPNNDEVPNNEVEANDDEAGSEYCISQKLDLSLRSKIASDGEVIIEEPGENKVSEDESEDMSDDNSSEDSSASDVDFNCIRSPLQQQPKEKDIPKGKERRKSAMLRSHGSTESDNVALSAETVVVADVEEITEAEENNQISDVEPSNHVNITTTSIPAKKDEISQPKPKKLPSFCLDRSKYGTFNTTLAANPLMQTLADLKNNFPFKDHIKSIRGTGGTKTCSLTNAFDLDGVTLQKDTPVDKSDCSKLSSSIHTSGKYSEASTDNSKTQNTSKNVDRLMKKCVLPDDLEKLEKTPKLFESKNSTKLKRKKEREETAGKGWYNLPKTEVTEKIKSDLQVIKMRNVLDSKHHYKRNDTNKLPTYFQMGTVVAGAHEFYSSRVPKKQRKRTMVDELLDDAEYRRKNKKKYIEIRKKQMSGGKGFYKQMKNKKKETWERD